MKRVFKCHYCGKPGHLKHDCCIRIVDERRKASDSRLREKANQVCSSASRRMCKDKKLFTMMKTLEKPLEMVLGHRHVVKPQQQGTVPLAMK